MSAQNTVACPQCGAPADAKPTNTYRPFCSRRCQLIDLGDWLDESHRIPDPSGSADPLAWQWDDPQLRH